MVAHDVCVCDPSCPHVKRPRDERQVQDPSRHMRGRSRVQESKVAAAAVAPTAPPPFMVGVELATYEWLFVIAQGEELAEVRLGLRPSIHTAELEASTRHCTVWDTRVQGSTFLIKIPQPHADPATAGR